MADSAPPEHDMPAPPEPDPSAKLHKRGSSLKAVDDDLYSGRPCCMPFLSRGSPLREAAVWLAKWKWFDRFILFVIGINCLTMAIDDQTKSEDLSWHAVRNIFEWAFFIIFMIEFIVKVTAMGFIMGDGAYLKDWFNRLDFVVVAGSILDKVNLSAVNVSAVRALRLLRPLKAVKSIPGMDVIVGAFIAGGPALFSVLMLFSFVAFLFSILAINLLSCKLRHRCWDLDAGEVVGGDPTSTDVICGTNANFELAPGMGWSQCGPRFCGGVEYLPWEVAYPYAVKAAGLVYNASSRAWDGCNVVCSDQVVDNGLAAGTKAVGQAGIYGQNPNYGITHFDNVASAFLTIFQCITLEGWTDVMYMVQDAEGGFATFFFFGIILFGSLIVLSLLLAVIEGTYSEEKERVEEEDAALDKEARAKAADAAAGTAAAGGPDSPKQDGGVIVEGVGDDEESAKKELSALGRFVSSEGFANFIMFCIVANAFTMMMFFDPRRMQKEAPALMVFLDVINWVFNIIFLIEMLAKMVGLGLGGYFGDPLNWFDFFIVMLSIVNTALFFMELEGFPGASALRALRAFRVLKLVRSIESLRSLLAVLLMSMGNIVNVAILLFLVIFIFALFGMTFFGGKLNEITGEGLPRSHFDTFGYAVGTIFQILTGENWNEVMYNCMGVDTVNAKSESMTDPSNIGAALAGVYFILVNFLGNFIMLNLFLAVLLGSFAGVDKPGILDVKITVEGFDHDKVEEELMAKGYEETASLATNQETRERHEITEEEGETNHALYVYDDNGAPHKAKLWYLYGLPEDMKLDDNGNEDPEGDETPVITHLTLATYTADDDPDLWEEKDTEPPPGWLHKYGRNGEQKAQDEWDALCCLEKDYFVLIKNLGTLAPYAGKGVDEHGAGKKLCLLGARLETAPINLLVLAIGDSAMGDDNAFSAIKVFNEDDEKSDDLPKGAAPLLRPATAGSSDDMPFQPAYLYSSPTTKGKAKFDTTNPFYDKPPFHHISLAVKNAEDMANKVKSSQANSPRLSQANGDVRSNKVTPDGAGGSDDRLGERAMTSQRLVPNPLSDQEILDNRGKACCIFPADAPPRSWAITITEDPKIGFDTFIMVCIFIGTICLAVDEPIPPEVEKEQFIINRSAALQVIDTVLTMIFGVEMLLKMLALGFVFGPNAYWRIGWNIMDGAVVIIAFVSFFSSLSGSSGGSLKALKALRAFRALRPLRAVSRVPSLKTMVNAILMSFPAVMSAFVINLLFMVIFSIMGVQMFAGTFDYCMCMPEPFVDWPDSENADVCNPWHIQPSVFPYEKHMGYYTLSGIKDIDPAKNPLDISADGVRLTKKLCVGNDDPDHNYGWYTNPDTNTTYKTKWVNRFNGLAYNCDTTPECLITLFEVSTLEGWLDVMYSGMDKTGLNVQPERNDLSAWTYIVLFWFVLFIIMCSFLFVNLFVGVIIDNFNDIKAQEDGSIFLTQKQVDWVASQDMVVGALPKQQFPAPMKGGGTGLIIKLRQMCYELWWDVENNDTNKGIDSVIMTIIMLNTLTMAFEHCNQEQAMTEFLAVCNLFFNIIYTMEMCTKLMAFHCVGYWKVGWNKFDGTIVVLSWIGMIIRMGSVGGGSSTTKIITLLRVARVARVFKIIKTQKTLRAMIQTLAMSAPALMNVVLLLVLMMFIFACLGMNLFAGVTFGDNLNRYANFNTLGSSLSLMFRFSTGEYWNGIQHDLTKTALHDTGCDPAQESWGNNCGDPHWPRIYFDTYAIFLQIILMNLFIAVILEKFDENKMDKVGKLTPDQIDEFCNVWVRSDPDGTGVIQADQLATIVKRLPHQWYFPLIKQCRTTRDIRYSNKKFGKFSLAIAGSDEPVMVSEDQTTIRWAGKRHDGVKWVTEPPKGGDVLTVLAVTPSTVTLSDGSKFDNPHIGEVEKGCFAPAAVPEHKEKFDEKEPDWDDCNVPSRLLTANECLTVAKLLNVSPNEDMEILFGRVLTALCQCTKGSIIPEEVTTRCERVTHTNNKVAGMMAGADQGVPMNDVVAAVMVQKVYQGRKHRKNSVFPISAINNAAKPVKVIREGFDHVGATTKQPWTSPPSQPRVNFDGQILRVQWCEALPKVKTDGKTLQVDEAAEGQQGPGITYEGRPYTVEWITAPSKSRGKPLSFTVEIDPDQVKLSVRASAKKGHDVSGVAGRIKRIVTLEDGARMWMPINWSTTPGPHKIVDIDVTKSASVEGTDFAHVNGTVTLEDGSQFLNPCKKDEV